MLEEHPETVPLPGIFDLAFFGRALQTARVEHGLSQERLSDVAGVPRSAIYLMEAGEAWMLLPYWLRVCRVLNLSTDDLAGLNRTSVERELYLEMQRCPGIATLFLQFLQTPQARPRRRTLTP